MMISADPLLAEAKNEQGMGAVNRERALWLARYFAGADAAELNGLADKYGLRQELSYLRALTRKYSEEFWRDPKELWRKLLYEAK